MLDDDVIAFIFVGDIKFIQKVVSRLSDHHSTEELASQPCTTARSHTLLNECDLHNNSAGRTSHWAQLPQSETP